MFKLHVSFYQKKCIQRNLAMSIFQLTFFLFKESMHLAQFIIITFLILLFIQYVTTDPTIYLAYNPCSLQQDQEELN